MKMAKPAPRRKAANGYKLAEPLPKGEILQDVGKKKWKLGPSIGQGGFGEIYSAQEADAKGSKYPYVIKIEPHGNGPLFVEMHFYMRNAKPADVENFKKEKDLKRLGMPLYLGSGSHDYKDEKYRFIVMEKFGIDLWKIFLEHNRSFPVGTVFKIAVQVLDVLEYIHSRGYVHADIKGANILMGLTKETQNKQVYLVDFGLATKYNTETEFKPNPKKAHDGTIEYLSRDAHKGVQTRRGDLEILAYNLIQWLGCPLPWEKNLKDPKVVQKCKEEYMENVPKMIRACFGNKTPAGAIVDFLNYLQTLNFNSDPDYKRIRKFFLSAIKDAGTSLDSPLQFTASKNTPQKRKSAQALVSPKKKKISVKAEESEDEKENLEENEDVPVRRRGRAKKQGTDEETPKKKVPSKSDETGDTPTTRRGRSAKAKKVSEEEDVEESNGTEDPYAGYTEAMKEVMLRKQAKAANKRPARGKKTEKIPVATTSRANDKKGLGKPTSQLRRPFTHGEILDGYVSDSE